MREDVKIISVIQEDGYTENYRIKGIAVFCLRFSDLFSFEDAVIEEACHFQSGLLQRECLDVCAITNTARNNKGISAVDYCLDTPGTFLRWHDDFFYCPGVR